LVKFLGCINIFARNVDVFKANQVHILLLLVSKYRVISRSLALPENAYCLTLRLSSKDSQKTYGQKTYGECEAEPQGMRYQAEPGNEKYQELS
jgi:hypothetical protein